MRVNREKPRGKHTLQEVAKHAKHDLVLGVSSIAWRIFPISKVGGRRREEDLG
jgi:hypothetical protein